MNQVGRYQILDELGHGATGVVYKALDPTIGRTIAIKAIPLGEAGDAEEKRALRERLLQEAQSAGRLSHPNIVTIYDILESTDFVHILMEYIDGDSLQDLLLSGTLPAPRDLLSFLRQIADGLDYAHRKGIVHRDIKPANILISKQQPEGERFAKIADFGVASFVSHEPAQHGGVIGTPNYMSPEQIQGLAIAGASDQFALGAIVYELLTGEKPFNADGLPALFYQICKQTPKPVESLNPALHDTVGKVMNRVLSKDPAQRFASCVDFIGALSIGLSEGPEWLPTRATVANVPVARITEAVAAEPPVVAAAAAVGAGVATAVASAPVQAAAIPKPVEPPVEVPQIINVDLPEGLKAAVDKQIKAEAGRSGAPPRVRSGLADAAAAGGTPRRELSRPGDPPIVRPTQLGGGPLTGRERRERRQAAEQDLDVSASRGKFWLILALCVAVGSAALFIIRWNSGAVIPTQVLDTKTGPASPPPSDVDQTAQHPPADLNPPPASPPPAAKEAPLAAPEPKVATNPQPVAPPALAQQTPVVPRERSSLNQPSVDRSISDVELITDPPGAKVTVDGNPFLSCTAPCALNVPGGRHTLVAELSGYAVMRKIFNAPAQDNVFVSLEQNMGVLFLSTIPPGSPVSVDGQARGRTPLTLKLPAGPHRLTLFDGAQRRHDETIEVDAQGMHTRTFTWQR